MEYYDYFTWIEWPETDIREYASEIASDNLISAEWAKRLAARMAERAGYMETRPERIGPKKMSEESEQLFRSIGEEDADIFAQNQRLNRPRVPPIYDPGEMRQKILGAGLTQRFTREWVREPTIFRVERKRARRKRAQRPYLHLISEIRALCEDAMWQANCYPVGAGEWLIWGDHNRPYESLVWYSEQLEQFYYNGRKQAELGNIEAAMFHAFRAGVMHTELTLLMARGTTFEKYLAVNSAQRDAAKSRKTISDELRQETYWKFRKAGNKKVESGRLAGAELGLSEPSIRNAFPDSKYPDD
jgi:hypothetical protein